MRKITLFTGSGTALITPYTENSIDFDAFAKLIEFQIANKTDALIVCGTTGEPSTMTKDEKKQVISFCIKQTAGRVPVIAGVGTNNTAECIENAKMAYSVGADALLVVTPYYNKCTQKGLVEHFKAVAAATPLPIIIYNVPSRTGVNVLPATLLKLAEIDTVIAMKEASGNIEQITEMCLLCNDKIDMYSGDDGITLPVLSLGGKGIISVASNIAPLEMHNLCQYYFEGNIDAARALQFKLFPLVKALFCEVNPIPVKTAASLMGICSAAMRLPLCAMEEKNLETLKSAMKTFGINF